MRLEALDALEKELAKVVAKPYTLFGGVGGADGELKSIQNNLLALQKLIPQGNNENAADGTPCEAGGGATDTLNATQINAYKVKKTWVDAKELDLLRKRAKKVDDDGNE